VILREYRDEGVVVVHRHRSGLVAPMLVLSRSQWLKVQPECAVAATVNADAFIGEGVTCHIRCAGAADLNVQCVLDFLCWNLGEYRD